MKKATSVKEFVERVDASKKVNPKDLSSDQDLTIAIMNLISIEEHLMFSGAKTGKTSFYDMIAEIRQMRKDLMLQVIPDYEGEVWCISKHLLASAMRLFEVGTKQQSMGRTEKAYDLFNKSYDLYCLFWALNMNLIDTKDVKWLDDDEKKTEEIVKKINSISSNKPQVKSQEKETSFFSKFKSVVKKAVDCCIE